MRFRFSGTGSTISVTLWSLLGTNIWVLRQGTADSCVQRPAPESCTISSNSELESDFGDDSSAHVVEVNKMLVVVINQRLVVRFKLFHPDKTSSNIRTGQVRDYREQRDIPELRNQLDLIGELSNLEAGYILDQLESEIRETWLVCPSGLCASAWKREIRNTNAATGVPEPSAAPLFPSPTTIVLPKETTVVTFKRTDKGRETS